jgi:hypothetical protein
MISFGLCSRARRSTSSKVDQVVVGPHAVLDGVEPLARLVGRRAVGQVAAGGEAHAHDRVARLEQRQMTRLVGLRRRVRLDVGEAAAEQRLARSMASVSAMSTYSQPP